MGLKKRITQERKVISRVDSSLALLPADTIKGYWKSLDIEDIGDLGALIEPPTVWTIRPMLAKYAHLDQGHGNNNAASLWQIFSLHVTGCDDPSLQLSYEPFGDVQMLSESVREQIPEDWIADIANMVIQLANSDGTHVPFDVQATLVAITSDHRIKANVRKPPANNAPSEDASDSDSATS
jgi:hypothetical protein